MPIMLLRMKILWNALFVLLLVQQTMAIVCYVCRSKTDRDCGENQTVADLTRYAFNCDAEIDLQKDVKSTACVKTVIKLLGEETVVGRHCSYRQQAVTRCITRGDNRVQATMCTCETDMCNL